jgi:hypothetical protein
MRGQSGSVRIPGSLVATVAWGLVVALPMSCARQPKIDVEHFVCETKADCPADRICSQGICVLSGGVGRDAATNSPGPVEPASADASSVDLVSSGGFIDATPPMADSNLSR